MDSANPRNIDKDYLFYQQNILKKLKIYDMSWINKYLLISEKVIGTLLLGLMFTVISLNIVCRYVFDKPIFWAEEISNFFFVWMAFLSCAYTVGRNEHIKVTIIINLFNEKFKRIVALIMNFILIVLFISLVLPCWKVLDTLNVSAAMRMPEKYVYAVIPIVFLASAFHVGITICSLIFDLIKLKKVAKK